MRDLIKKEVISTIGRIIAGTVVALIAIYYLK
jgi:hypothetical protein